ncbi:hypothetical protein OQA88_5200 [Cercophora sp. LCS_1]
MFIFHLFVLLNFDGSLASQVTTGPAATPTTLIVQKRAPLVTRFSSIFFSGDASKPRTAEVGFDARVDIDRSLWGFCPTSVLVASDCGLAGNCVDHHACSRGCGKGGGLTTFTCTGSNGEFCTTAELYLTGGIGPFSYIGCGSGPTTDRYSAFTTTPTPTVTSTSTPPPSSTPSKTPSQTSILPTTPSTETTSSSSTSSTSAAAAVTSDAASEPPSATVNDTGAIIGGVIGCVALICGSGIVALWLLRRQKNKNNLGSKPASLQELVPPPPGPAPAYNPEADVKLKYPPVAWSPPELDDRFMGPSELGAMRSPVELPAN